jgi:1,2-phenylacetyl-CoA epoxidase catalytic subunit
MFGRSTSTASAAYVKWGIQKHGNEQLRQQYIADTRPMLAKIGIQVPDDLVNRRFT